MARKGEHIHRKKDPNIDTRYPRMGAFGEFAAGISILILYG